MKIGRNLDVCDSSSESVLIFIVLNSSINDSFFISVEEIYGKAFVMAFNIHISLLPIRHIQMSNGVYRIIYDFQGPLEVTNKIK